MKVSDQDADLFFELMFPLQFFVNQQLRILPEVNTLEEYLICSMEQMLPVRDALYDSPSFIDAFIQQNPHQLSTDNLALIAKWKQFISGEFYIERFLKRHAVFIASGDKVYGVLALHQPLQEIFHPSQLPILVKAVLLPFKGNIIYDGLLRTYNVHFGRGISSDLKETYMAAKQHGRIIESLEPELQPAPANLRHNTLKDWRPEIEALVAEAQKLRYGAGQPPIQGSAFSLVKASLELARSAVQNPEDPEALWKSMRKVGRALSQVETTLERGERHHGA